MTVLRRISDIDAELLRVHADYLKAERRRQPAEAAELWTRLDDLLCERLHATQQRTGS